VNGQAKKPTPQRQDGSRWRYLPLGLVLLGVAGIFVSGAHRYLSLEMLVGQRDWIKAFAEERPIQALGLFVAIYAAVVALSIPASAFLTIIGGFLFGWKIGLLAALFGATAGATGVFLIVRTSLGEILLRRAGPRVQGLAAGFRRNATAYLLFIRVTPVVPFWVTNIAAALFRVPLRTFLLTTPLGMAPVSLAFAVAGSGLDGFLMDRQRERTACLAAGGGDCAMDISIQSLLSPELILAFGGLGLLALLPVAVKRYYGAKVQGDGHASDSSDG
jgi:uncharacterized membrane protein YdjX (TVP38/TMEM64 family)